MQVSMESAMEEARIFVVIGGVLMKILILALVLTGCGKSIEVKDILPGEAPQEYITPCLVTEWGEAANCYEYDLNKTRKFEDGKVIRHETTDTLPAPSVVLSPEDFLKIRRIILFFIPKAYTALKQHKITEEQLHDWLDEHLPGGE